jgi:hypothetical protein
LHCADRPSVLEPKVEYLDGKWRMRFLSIPVGLTSRDWPDYTIYYSESADGVTQWSEPTIFTSNDSDHGFFDSVMLPGSSGM